MVERAGNFLLFTLFIVFSTGPAWSETYITSSPDNNVQFELNYSGGELTYKLYEQGSQVISETPLAIVINEKQYPGESAVTDVKRHVINNEIKPTVATVRATIKEYANETLVTFGNQSAIRVRVFNDGAAFRWETSLAEEEVIVQSEQLAFNFAKDYALYWPSPNGEGFFSHQENMFEHKSVSKVLSTVSPASGPLLVDRGNGRFVLITDVNVESYPGMWFRGTDSKTIYSVFPGYPKQTKLIRDRDLTVSEYHPFLAKTTGQRKYPWRAFVTTDAKGLLNSNLLYTLADPSRIDDTAWIKPGKVAWDWFNHWNLTDVDFEPGINQKTYMNYIDFAAENNLDYIILDEGWSVPGPENLLEVIPQINMPALVDYAHNKGIGVVLWMTLTALDYNFDDAFKAFDKWQIDGLKVDFVQRDDQVMMDFCVQIAEQAAKQQLLVDFHGGSKPTGLQRTYPNVLTHESVMGLEQTKWSRRANPDMAVLLPFIRMVVGPMDYTPGAMDNFSAENFRLSFENPASLGTRAHQLAMYVAYLSPLQMLADTPSKYRREPTSMAFLSQVPTTWDDTVVLNAHVGESLSVARRHGDKWYISAMTNWQARDVLLPLDFLGKGNYKVTYWADGDKTGQKAEALKVGEIKVSAESYLPVTLAPGGGYVAIVEAQ